MASEHRAASAGSGRRRSSSKRKWQRVGPVSKGEPESGNSVATYFPFAWSAARTAADVSQVYDVDLALDCKRSAAIGATFLQDCVDGRVDDRGKDREKDSGDSRSRTWLLRASRRSLCPNHRRGCRA